MDPLKKIAELKAERSELKQQLATPGIDKDREIAIRHNIDTVGNEITALYGQLPPPPDNRTWRERARESLVEQSTDPIVLSGSVVSASVWIWFIMRNYMSMRHHRGAYTAEQANWRKTVFLIHLPHVPGAVRIGAWAGLLAVIRSWTLPPPPGWPPGGKYNK